MKKDIRILIVDDHQVVRDGLQRMLEQEEDMEVIGQSDSSQATLAQLETVNPNVILMDIKMPEIDGIELTRRVKRKRPSCNVIVLTLYDQYLTQAMEAKASGYLLKDIKREELAQAIRQVHSGQVVISESITSQARFEYEGRRDREVEEGSGATVEEVQLVLPPPVEANRLMRFAGRAEEGLQSRVLQVVGSWQDGTVMTIVLPETMQVADILNKFREMPEVETVEEKPSVESTSHNLLKKAAAVPRLRNRPRKTIFVTLEKD